MTGPVVIKLGGSLLEWSELPARLADFLGSMREGRKVLIAGGGQPAHWVRELDQRFSLGDDTAHILALRALDLTAELVTHLVPGLERIEHLRDCERVWNSDGVPVIVARTFLDDDEAGGAALLPRSWDVTTDSIAAVLAHRLGAQQLILLKSARLPGPIDRNEAARLGLVDAAFPELSRPVRHVLYLNLREPDAGGVSL